VREEGGVGERPAFLAEAAGHTIRLWVTGNIPREVWYQLLESPEIQQSVLRLCQVGSAVLPAELAEFAEHHPTLPKQALVRALLANDIDYAETCLNREADSPVRRYPLGIQTLDTSFLYQVWRTNGVLYGAETDVLKALKRGEPLILKGSFSLALMQHLQSLFTSKPYLMVNGERVEIRAPIMLVSDNEQAFRLLPVEKIRYESQIDLQRLEPAFRERLSSTFQRLNITPCHSHFFGLPDQLCEQGFFVESLIQRLYLSAGQQAPNSAPASSSSSSRPATTARDIASALANQRLLVLVSDTGEGKSHLMEAELEREYPDFKVYYGREERMQWAMSTAKKPLIFFDEANADNDADFSYLESLARRERSICLDGYDIQLGEHVAVLALNPGTYSGRKQPDLLKRFPFYLPFIGVDIDSILSPFQSLFEQEDSLRLISHYYRLAKEEGLPVTPRNALMMCASAFAIKTLHHFRGAEGERMAVFCAVYYGLKSAGFQHKELRHSLRQTVKKDAGYKPQLPLIALDSPPERFVWTVQRQKLLAPFLVFLEINRLKAKGTLPQGMGQNVFLLEGESGYAKTIFFREALSALGLSLAPVRTDSILHTREDLLYAWDNGHKAPVDEFSSFPDIPWLLKLLANAHPETGRPPKTPGFALLITQNPISYKKREKLCMAMYNRMMIFRPKVMQPEEFQEILERSATLPPGRINQLARDFKHAYEEEGPQNPRDWFMRASEPPEPVAAEPLELAALENYFASLLTEIKNTNLMGHRPYFFTGRGGHWVDIQGHRIKVPDHVASMVGVIHDYQQHQPGTLARAVEAHRRITHIAETALAHDKHSRARGANRFYQRTIAISEAVSVAQKIGGTTSQSITPVRVLSPSNPFS
jgi:MoxR-like ATPase